MTIRTKNWITPSFSTLFLLKAIKSCILSFSFFSLLISSALAETVVPEWRYSVRKGDTLTQIAKQYLNDSANWRMLQAHNKIKNPHDLYLGKVLRMPLSMLKQTLAPAEIVLISGVANIKWVDRTQQVASVGTLLGAGAQLITGKNSKIKLKLADGSIVTLESESTLNLDTLSIFGGGGMVDTKLRLQQGKVEIVANPNRAQSNMQIYTPTAVAAVRGTEFRVSTDESGIRQETLTGNVILTAAGNDVAVVKGFGSLSENGRAPLPPILLLDAPDVSDLPKKLEVVPVSFTLPVQDKAIGYVAKISSDAKFNTILASNLKPAVSTLEDVTNNNRILFDDLPDGEYFLKVRAKDQKGLEGYDSTHTFLLNARPFAPKTSSPSINAIVREANPTLTWSKIDAAKSYLLELAYDSEFIKLVDQFKLSATELKIEKPLTPGQYFWRLASIDGADQGPFAASSNFIYKLKPAAPDISQIKIKVLENRVYVSTIEPPSGLTYQVQLSNKLNAQKKVWVAQGLMGEFDFLLKEYGQQTLSLSLVEPSGVHGPEAIVEFMAMPQ